MNSAITFGWGYLLSGIMFAIMIGIVTLGHYIFKGILTVEHRHFSRNAVFAFWLAYILTRPLGASFADYLCKPQSFGGVGWGDGTVTLILIFLIIIFVSYVSFRKKRVTTNV